MSYFLRGIFIQYWEWYFVDQVKFLLKAWRNFLVFGNNFFSIITLVKSFFAPWHRYYMPYGRGFDIRVWAEAIVSNLIFRALGVIARTVVIAAGVVFEACVFVFGLLAVLIWLALPFFLIFAFVLALKFLVY